MGLRWDFTLFFDYHGMGWEKLIFVKNGLFPIPWYGMGIGSLKPSHAQAWSIGANTVLGANDAIDA